MVLWKQNGVIQPSWPLWDMEPADAAAYFGKVLRNSPGGTRLARSQALTTYVLFLELRHNVELHRMTGRVIECPIDEMNRPRRAKDAQLRTPPTEPEVGAPVFVPMFHNPLRNRCGCWRWSGRTGWGNTGGNAASGVLYLGVPLDMTGLTNQSLMLHGMEVVFVPAAMLFLGALALVGIHTLVLWQLARSEEDSEGTSSSVNAFLAYAFVLVGVLLIARTLIGIFIQGPDVSVVIGATPLALAFGPVAVAYGVWIRDQQRESPLLPQHLARNGVLCALALTVAGLFWASTQLAWAYGTGRGEEDAADLRDRARGRGRGRGRHQGPPGGPAHGGDRPASRRGRGERGGLPPPLPGLPAAAGLRRAGVPGHAGLGTRPGPDGRPAVRQGHPRAVDAPALNARPRARTSDQHHGWFNCASGEAC